MAEDVKTTEAMEQEKTLHNEKEEAESKFREKQEAITARLREAQEKAKESREAIQEERGILTLEKPILSADKEVTELPYDFNELTTMDLIEAMDSDLNSNNAYRVTYRQGMALFAKAAAKMSETLDMRDILDRMGAKDAVIAAQLGMLFYTASNRTGQLHISKM